MIVIISKIELKGLPDALEDVIITRFVDRKVLFIVATGRKPIANNPHPALKVGGVSAFFHKNSTSRDGGAKGPDTPRQGAVVGYTSLLLELCVAHLVCFT